MNKGEVKKCIKCEKNFLIIPQEEDFYKRKSLPKPKICYVCRRKRRMNLRNKRKLYDRNCDKCGVNLKSTYAKDSEYIVYCEECYLESVN